MVTFDERLDKYMQPFRDPTQHPVSGLMAVFTGIECYEERSIEDGF